MCFSIYLRHSCFIFHHVPNQETWSRCRINQTNNRRKPPSPHCNSKTRRPTLYQTADGRSRDACTTAAQALCQLSTRASKHTTFRNPQGIYRICDAFAPQIQKPNKFTRNHGGEAPYGCNSFPKYCSIRECSSVCGFQVAHLGSHKIVGFLTKSQETKC